MRPLSRVLRQTLPLAAVLALLLAIGGVTLSLWVARNSATKSDQSDRVAQSQTEDAALSKRTTLGNQGLAHALAFTADGQLLAVMEAGLIKLFDVANGNELATLSAPNQGSFLTLSFAGDGKTLASASSQGAVILWDVQRAQEVVRFSCPELISNMRLSLDGQMLT